MRLCSICILTFGLFHFGHLCFCEWGGSPLKAGWPCVSVHTFFTYSPACGTCCCVPWLCEPGCSSAGISGAPCRVSPYSVCSPTFAFFLRFEESHFSMWGAVSNMHVLDVDHFPQASWLLPVLEIPSEVFFFFLIFLPHFNKFLFCYWV